MSLVTGENPVIENEFGAVTNKRVIYFVNKGWFSGGSREDVPLKQVVSIRHETKRWIFAGLVQLAVGALFVVANNGWGTALFGVLLMASGGLNLWGSPIVNIVTAGGTQAPTTGFPWRRTAAREFVAAVRNQLFQE
jgi:hypothetical protein